MAYNNQHSIGELPPKALFHFLLVAGLAALAYAIITQNLIAAIAVICFPLASIILIYGLQTPRFGYLLYATYAYYFMVIMRYSRKEGLSVGLDILLVYIFISILFISIRKKSDIKLSNAINVLTVTYIVWILFILVQLVNPGIHSEGITAGIRNWIVGTLVLYLISCLLLDSPKMLKRGLIVWGIFTITAFLKLLYQRYVGFDYAEKIWLINGGAVTHILNSGIRYFSFFSDAGNFGPHMGIITIVYSIVGFHTRQKWLAWFYRSIALMGLIGLLMSGTRGAIIVPLGGIALYCLLCKSVKVMMISAITGLFLFAFFSFTNIGNGNSFIRRMRTAFQPTQDASYNVRIENRKQIAEYLKTLPLGVGLEEDIPKLWPAKDGSYIEGNLPPDSYYVSIWIQTGIVGLVLQLIIYGIILLRCYYIVMFRIQNRELMHTLAALTCGTFGMWLNGYVGEGMGQPPTNFVLVASLAFIMNGAYIDKQISKCNQNSNKKTSNTILL